MKAKTKLHKLLSLLLTLAMVLGMLPAMSITAFADYETGMECPDCGHYHWDTYMCFCGYCSEECTNATCWAENHCVRCGTCHEVTAYCAECGWCQECMEEEGHCLDCYKCVDSDDDLCQTCGKCEDCVGWLCMDCGQCDECTDDGEFHCEECGGCYESNGHNHGTHCADCCEICDQCGECIILNETEFCYECGLCVECCDNNRYDSDCTCYEYCVESVDFEEHFCEQCGTCFGEVEQCDECGLCVDCCADNSECSESMCVEDSDYEEHFCEDCGTCFHDAEMCETCESEGELRCVYCCEALSASFGCDCGDMCSNDPEFEDHLDEAHSDGETGEHTHRAKIAWAMDGENHWHECRYCDEYILDEAAHSFDAYGVCTVCGFQNGKAVFITRQPKDAYAKVSDPNPDDDNDPLSPINNQVSFQVSAFGKGELNYQWYRVKNDTNTKLADKEGLISGANENKLTVYVPTDACYETYEYFCIVSDTDGHQATSERAELRSGHVYDLCLNVPETETITKFYRKNGSGYDIIEMEDTLGHEWRCHSYSDGCDKVKSRKPLTHRSDGTVKIVEGTFMYGSAEHGNFKTYYQYRCADCGYLTFVEKHEHTFECVAPDVGSPDREAFEAACVGLTHPLVCTVDGCGETRTEVHKWNKEIVGWPGAGSEKGALHLVCTVCEYWIDGTWKDKDNHVVYWTADNMLVTADFGTVNRSLAEPGDTLKLTPDRRVEDGNYQKCTGWTASYEYWDAVAMTTKTKDVTLTVTDNGDGTWSCTLPTFETMGVPGGGHLIFTAQFGDCDHSCDQIREGYREAVCLRSGYSGDLVCADCGKLFATGNPTASAGEHEGPITPIDGTAIAGSCTVKGYEGDSECAKCGLTFKGKTTGYVHENQEVINEKEATCTQDGYTGDTVCSDCGKILKYGTVIRAKHQGEGEVKNAKDATCTETGYSGDTVCEVCGEVMLNGHSTPVIGHDWDEGEVTSSASAYARGVITYTCTREGCDATRTAYFARLVPIGKVDVTVTAPVRGGTPNYTAQVSNENCTVAAVDWEPTGDVFSPKTVYTVKVTLEAADGCGLSSASFTINGKDATVVTSSDEQAVISFAFPATAGTPSGGGGSGVSTYAITVDSAKNGDVTSSHKSAAKGTTITLTVEPDKGYTLETITATDASGNKLKLTEKDGKYTFTMPASKVTVKATFMEDNSMLNFFVDVPADAYYYDAVLWAAEEGITGGVDATHFAPNATCTRAQAVTFLWRAAGSPAPKSSEMPFTDVAAGSYYETAVLWAVENGITKGTSDTTFTPNAKCTRAQIVTFLWRSQKSPAADSVNPFADVAADTYYNSAVLWAVTNGITDGTSTTTFSPAANCTRAQIVTFLFRCLG